MGQRGPLPKVTELRLIDNDNKNRIKGTPGSPAVKKPVMPSGLDDLAQKEWRRVADPLWRAGLLTELDKLTLSIYCQLVSRFERYDALCKSKEVGESYETTSGLRKPTPEYQMRENATKELRLFIKEFGLSPNSRFRMVLPQAADNELDEFESLLD
jgi:P27 family predicted phage terminase small subunit